ncbi:MAG: HEAT repeat domain-containing protein [Pirellulaceae bacterium]
MNHPQPNSPFAYRRRKYSKAWPWWVAIGLVIFFTVVVAPKATNWYLLGQLTDELDTLPLQSQADRIAAIGHLGLTGIPVLVQSLAHDDRGVARVALQTLSSLQDEMMQKGSAAGANCHYAITTELSTQLPNMPEDRYPWIQQLLNKTLLDTLDLDLQRARTSYRTATVLLSQLRLPADPIDTEPSLLANLPSTPVTDTVLRETSDRQQQPLPLDQPLEYEPLVRSAGPENAIDEDLWIDPTQRIASSTSSAIEAPADDSTQLQPAMMARPAATLGNSGSPSTEEELQIGGPVPILSAGGYSTTGALEAYSTRAVIDLLSSIRKPLAQSARNELIRRGFQPSELNLAMRLASTNAEVRIGLIDEITKRSDIDPRQWLLWLADDGERSIRLRALSALGTMDDPNVIKELRALLAGEQDPAVAARIRQALVR